MSEDFSSNKEISSSSTWTVEQNVKGTAFMPQTQIF